MLELEIQRRAFNFTALFIALQLHFVAEQAAVELELAVFSPNICGSTGSCLGNGTVPTGFSS
jgi:hypothetical protein